MRVFSALMPRSNARTRVAWELMRVEIWEARVCMRIFSTLMSSWSNWREQELHESWWEYWEARICMRVFSTLVSWSNENKSCMRVDESWEARICMRVFSTLMPRSNENKSCMRVDESWPDIIVRVAKTLINSHKKFEPAQKVDECAWEATRICHAVKHDQFSSIHILDLVWPRFDLVTCASERQGKRFKPFLAVSAELCRQLATFPQIWVLENSIY